MRKLFRSRQSQSGVSLVLFAFFGLVLLLFAGFLIGIDGYYSAIQRLDGAGQSGALSAGADLCTAKYNTGTYSIDRYQAINDVADLLNKSMAPATAYATQTAPSNCNSDTLTQNAAYACPTLTPGNVGTVSYCLDFPRDSLVSAGNAGSVTVHMVWVVQQPFAGVVGPPTLNIFSTQTAIARRNSPGPTPSTLSYAATVVRDGPLAYWRLNESICTTNSTAADSSTLPAAQLNPAIYYNVNNNSLACGVSGPLGGSLNAGNTALDETVGNGNGSRIHSSFTHANPLTGDNARTVEMWFADNNAAGNNILFEGGTLASQQAMQISVQRAGQLANSGNVSTAGILIEFSSGLSLGADEVFIPTDTAIDGVWHLLDVTLSGNAVVVYIDGVASANGYVNASNSFISSGAVACGGRVCTLPLTPNTVTNSSGVQSGGADEPGLYTRGFNGQIDEVAIYGTALTPQQVLQRFAAR